MSFFYLDNRHHMILAVLHVDENVAELFIDSG